MNINENNRPPVVLNLGDVSSDVTQTLFIAHKKTRIRMASIVQELAIAASGANYVTGRLKVNNVNVGLDSDTQDGLAARTPLHMLINEDKNYVDLEIGDVLSLDLKLTGTGALTNAIVVMDMQIIGN